GIGLVQQAQSMQQSTFTRAGSTNNGHHLATTHLQIHPGEHLNAVATFLVVDADIARAQHGWSDKISHDAAPVQVEAWKHASLDTAWPGRTEPARRWQSAQYRQPAGWMAAR